MKTKILLLATTLLISTSGLASQLYYCPEVGKVKANLENKTFPCNGTTCEIINIFNIKPQGVDRFYGANIFDERTGEVGCTYLDEKGTAFSIVVKGKFKPNPAAGSWTQTVPGVACMSSIANCSFVAAIEK